MIRTIIEIDEAACDGCGICVNACHEGALGMVDGKAKLLRDDYCDGLGDCLPACPTGAIAFVKREATAYDEAAVEAGKVHVSEDAPAPVLRGCPGSRMRTIEREDFFATEPSQAAPSSSQLFNWPVQIKLAPLDASYFQDAHLLIAADCAAFAYGNFHAEFLRDKVALIGCPKLDAVDYSEKLTEILVRNDVLSVTVVRMEVPCCGGIEQAAAQALKASGKVIPWNVATISVDGCVLG